MNLEEALEQFDTVEANLRRLEAVWEEMQQLLPPTATFIRKGPVKQRYEELSRGYAAIARALPPIGTYRLESQPLGINQVARIRMDAEKADDDFMGILSAETRIAAPSREIEEYRARMIQTRRQLVRDDLARLIAQVDPLLRSLLPRVESSNKPITDTDWPKLVSILEQVERLTGSMVPRKARWRDMRRHLRVGQGIDLHDIARNDWPSVRAELEANLYSELEPLPVRVSNLASLTGAKPTGPVTTKLNWSAITAEEFERLLFNLVADASDYANPRL